ncbi:MAG: lysophospholipid acyltransferase family protein [Alphaproteobacteria bacterium]|nr:lysophospholipid acyltransferase family protein [Alphaproteobacteria bacterium]
MKKTRKKILKHPLVQRCLAFIGFLYIRFVYATNRWQFIGDYYIDAYVAAQKPVIICFWHGRLLMLPCAWKWKQPFTMLLSSHGDGRLISRVVDYLHINTVAGSTTRGGGKAALGLVKILKKGTPIGITPDGPRGPARQVSPGIVTLSRLAKADIIPVSYATSRRKILGTWDSFHLPLPFGRGVIVAGAPIPYPGSEVDSQDLTDRIKKALDAVLMESDVRVIEK